MSDRRQAYEAYLLSEHWSELRKSALNRANRKCEACRSTKRLVGHHLLYRDPLESCTADDIMCLCSTCHDMWHAWLDVNGKKTSDFGREETASHLRKMNCGKERVNGLSRKQLRKLRKKVKGGKLRVPPPSKPVPPTGEAKRSILETVVFEQGKVILALQARVTALELQMKTLLPGPSPAEAFVPYSTAA